jgi:hypothetical protein
MHAPTACRRLPHVAHGSRGGAMLLRLPNESQRAYAHTEENVNYCSSACSASVLLPATAPYTTSLGTREPADLTPETGPRPLRQLPVSPTFVLGAKAWGLV